jgi:hypothetical protein
MTEAVDDPSMNHVTSYKRLIMASWALLTVGGFGFLHGFTGFLLKQKTDQPTEMNPEFSINTTWLIVFAAGVVLNVAVESYLGRRMWAELAQPHRGLDADDD